MLRARAQILITRSRDLVYDFVALEFFRNYPRWSPEVVELQCTAPGPMRIGTTGRQVRIDHGRRTEAIFSVSRLEQGRCIEFRGISSPFRIAYFFEPQGRDTKLTFLFELSRLEFYLRLFENLIGLAIQRDAERVVRSLKALIEAEVPANFHLRDPQSAGFRGPSGTG